MFRKIRIAILLLILLSVALTAWRTSVRAHEWGIGQTIGLYPINADGSAATAAYLKTLDEDSFRPIQKYMTEEMRRHGIDTWDPTYACLDDPDAKRQLDAVMRQRRYCLDTLRACYDHRASGKEYYETIFWTSMVMN